ncbi:phosphoenolpyruvate carboxylase [Candidatus Woesearchaeota archaeon]|nr:phosphoenolpyruvate carboxylase [Candidatus Woesearchaeota archaeon]
MTVMKIPRVMSTQHPDNVTIPFFSEKSVMEGEDEVKEAYYSFSNLGVDEQLWDAEGKEVDAFVVKKLLSRYEDYFRKNVLGQDKFLTFRVPNPDVEKNDGKILLESLHSLPRNFDLGNLFYGKPIAPVFEAVLPMCSSEKSLIRIHEYYKQFVIKSQDRKLYDDDITLKEWVGPLHPTDIRVTPLFETKEAILNAHSYVEKYMKHEKIKEQQRVWFARSDPALTYGSTATVLSVKIGLQRLAELERKTSVEILPILGCGSAPFRGNFTPLNAHKMVAGYPSMQTFTVQSAFKYDYDARDVANAVDMIKSAPRTAPMPIDEKMALPYIEKLEAEYQKQVKLLVPTIHQMSVHIPQRRKRKLHIGLFGYARGNGASLPRAIPFCASLYSLGLPPDILGVSILSGKDLDRMRESYHNVDNDIKTALQYYNKDNLSYFPQPIQKAVKKALTLFDYEVNEEHAAMSNRILTCVKKNDHAGLHEGILAAGRIRRFLG